MRRSVFGFLLVMGIVGASGSASAGELQAAVGPSGLASTWRGDYGAGTGLRLGFRIKNLVSIDFVTRNSFVTVDTRMATWLSVGATLYGRLGKVRPYVRGFLVHQHEESMSAVKADPFGSLLGVGDGIRHRGGFGGGLGVDVPVNTSGAWQWFLGGGSDATFFPDVRGPKLYVALGAWLGVNYSL